MSDESKYPRSAVEGLTIDFDDDIATDERERIGESIGAMAQHAVESRERQSEVDAQGGPLRAAMIAPLNKLIEADSEEIISATARAQRHAKQFQPDPLPFPLVRPQDLLFDLQAEARALQVFGPPFHFLWHWHSGGPPPELAALDRPNGRINVAHTTGDSGDRQVSHHAGFGVSLRTDRERSFTARSLRRTSHSYSVSCGPGWDGTATVEGGTEMTVMENGTLLRFATDRVFRRRVSGTESAYVDPDGFTTGNSIELSWTMLPGSSYEFNVGAWVFCENQQPSLVSDGAYAFARVQALVIGMTVDEH